MSRLHLATIAAMPCVLCELLGMTQTSKTDVHHIREGQGGAQRAPDMLTIPLCHATCHQGPQGIHGDRSLLRLAKVEELDLLAIVFARVLGYDAPKEQAYKRPSKVLPRDLEHFERRLND